MSAQKYYILGGFGYHGNLLAVFGFWFWCVECQILYVGTPGQDWNVPENVVDAIHALYILVLVMQITCH